MNDSADQNESVKPESSSSASSDQHKKDIIVSIILTESTTSLLKLDLPHLEDIGTDNSQATVCTIKAERNIDETNYGKKVQCEDVTDFTEYWFGDEGENSTVRKVDCEEVLSEVAYLRSPSQPDIEESSGTSCESSDEGPATSGTASAFSLQQKLRATKIYTRPLFTVRGVAHENQMKSEENNLLIDVKQSEAGVTNSGWVNVCRICHGGESQGDLLSLCHCRGSIALAHLECLERWLKESANSRCELCQHHFEMIREPKYNMLWSVLVFLRHPGEHLNELLFDFFAFLIYTPAAVASTYMLILICESVGKSSNYSRNLSAHIMTLAAIFGMAAIDFTYSSWFMVNLQKHVLAWRSWYRNNCNVKLVLPERKFRRHRRRTNVSAEEVD